MRCKDKIVLVTGGSRGIGRGICLQMAAEGAKVVVNYLGSRMEAEEVVYLVEQAGGEAISIKADVSVKPEVDAMILQVMERYGRINVLVNNAGICPFSE